MKRRLFFCSMLLLYLCMAGYAQDKVPAESDETHTPPLTAHFKPKYMTGFVGLDLGGGVTAEPNTAFIGGIQAGITFFYKDMQASLMATMMGLVLNTSLYGGVDFSVAQGRFAWAPKVGVVQLLGFVLVGFEAQFYTPKFFQQHDIRLHPYLGLTLVNMLSVTVGPSIPVGPNQLPQVSRWRATFTIRIPFEFLYYMMGL